jgi:AcrR family transcriptional regulator
MTSEAGRRVRADASRNSRKIVRAAREVFAASGPEARLAEVAQHAGVGIATLYRHFPDKTELVRAVLDDSFTEEIVPVVEQALVDSDLRRGLLSVLEAAVALADRERNILAAAKNIGAFAGETGAPFFASLTQLLNRAQRAGVVRADLVADDMPRIALMATSVLQTVPPGSEGWRRYLLLILDALSPDVARDLPPAIPLWRPPHSEHRI